MTTTDIQPAVAERSRYQVEVRRDVRVPTAEPGVTLSVDLYLPVGLAQAPALVTVLPYRKDMFGGRGYDSPLRWFAEQGYACLLANLRGVGSSDGVQRPRLDPGEGDDGVAVIEWAAAQDWCTGAVGMWGISYGGAMTMRTASRRPAALKAIMPLSCSLDPERYKGERGDLGLLAQWGGQMLVEQLLPPLHEHTSPQQQHRWWQRLHESTPLIIDMAQHRPGDPEWRSRVIDPTLVTVPALCVGGWQDVFPDDVTRFYEKLSGPKKLIMGPWVHTLPQDSPFEAIDFLPIALRWWDHWLRGVDTGVLDEPAVSLFTLGHRPEWRTYKAWPPETADTVLATGDDTTLAAPAPGTPEHTGVIAEYRSDPTVGALSGLGGETSGVGLPLDQHEDDSRALSMSSAPLSADLLICGRAEVSVRLDTSAEQAPRRIVARLTDVDPHGRSLLISTGRIATGDLPGAPLITLRPTTYRLRAGHRLRVVLSDSDFPRLTPLPERHRIRLIGVTVSVPAIAEDEGAPLRMPLLGQQILPSSEGKEHWTITRDPVQNGIEVVLGSRGQGTSTDGRHILEKATEARSSVRRNSPDAASSSATHTLIARMHTGEVIAVDVQVRCTQTKLWVHGTATVNDLTVFSRLWEVRLGTAASGRQAPVLTDLPVSPFAEER